MKKLIFIALPVLIFSCTNGNSSSSGVTEVPVAIASFDWLLGNWQRVNEQKDMETFETWTKENDSEYKGFGFTLQNKDTVWQETIKLVERNGDWDFEVTGKGESLPTVFKLTRIQKGQFTCENQKNEFPKRISYSKVGNDLKAIISGEEMEIYFDFQKL